MERTKLAVRERWMSDKTLILIIQDLLKYFRKKLTKLNMDFHKFTVYSKKPIQWVKQESINLKLSHICQTVFLKKFQHPSLPFADRKKSIGQPYGFQNLRSEIHVWLLDPAADKISRLSPPKLFL
jgi:hypothetical protein